MLEDAARAVSQMFSPPLRAVLWKAIGLALALVVVVAIALNRLIVWLLGAGGAAVESGLGPHAHLPATILGWVLSIAAGLGILVGSVMLMPAVTAFVASFFADEVAEEVEREHYPADQPGVALPLWIAVMEGGKTALLAVLVYLCALPFLLFAGFGVVIFSVAVAGSDVLRFRSITSRATRYGCAPKSLKSTVTSRKLRWSPMLRKKSAPGRNVGPPRLKPSQHIAFTARLNPCLS